MNGHIHKVLAYYVSDDPGTKANHPAPARQLKTQPLGEVLSLSIIERGSRTARQFR